MSDELTQCVRLLDDADGAPSRFEIQTRLDDELCIWQRLSASEGSDADPIHYAAAVAFGYRVEEARQGGRRRVVFEPFFRGPGGDERPPALETIPSDVQDVWAQLADEVTAPYARARLHHLLFACHHGNGRVHAEAAIAAYSESARRWRRDFDAAGDLSVALRLSRAVRADDLARQVMDEAITAAADALESHEPIPGVTLRYLEPLIDERDAPTRLDQLLERAWESYPDPFIRDDVIALQLRRADAPSRAGLEAARVRLWLSAATGAEGIVRAAHLKKALEHATAVGRKDLIDLAAGELQKISREDLGLKAISVEMAIAEEQVEKLLEPLTNASTWQQALTVYGQLGPVTGDVASNRAEVDRNASRFVFSNLIPRELIGGDGLPRYFVSTEDEKRELAQAEFESQQMRMYASFLAKGLTEIRLRHGLPTEQGLAAFLVERPLVDESLAGSLARVLIRFWTGDYEGAAFTAAPRLETLARKIVIATGAGVYRLQRQKSPGQYPGLGALLELLRQRSLDESWFRFLYTLSANPAGWNVRNEISHGFIDDVQPQVAALLIQGMIYLTGLEPARPNVVDEAGGEEGDVSRTAPAEPVTPPDCA